jgi:hypothetical protein
MGRRRLPLVAFYRLVPGIFVLVHIYVLVQPISSLASFVER